MMSRTLGAPLGGTTRGGHHGVESLALSLITPPNDNGGGGGCFPSRVTGEPGEPGTPLICCARTMLEPKPTTITTATKIKTRICFLVRSFIIFVTRQRSDW